MSSGTVRSNAVVLLNIVNYSFNDAPMVFIWFVYVYKRCLSHGMCLYQVMMTLNFLNDVANEDESTQKSKITS